MQGMAVDGGKKSAKWKEVTARYARATRSPELIYAATWQLDKTDNDTTNEKLGQVCKKAEEVNKSRDG